MSILSSTACTTSHPSASSSAHTLSTQTARAVATPRQDGRRISIARSTRSTSGLDSRSVIALVVEALEALKGVDVVTIDIEGKSSIADAMIIATGTSQRHVNSLAESVRLAAKDANHPPLGIEGDSGSDWVLVDLGDVIAHVMTEEKREFYELEKLWSVGPAESDSSESAAPRPLLHSV